MPFTGLSPTGSTPVDALLVALATAAVVWSAASAPWWALTIAAAAAAAFSRELIALVAAVAAGITMAVIGARTLNLAGLRSVCALAIVFTTTRLEVPGPFGTESAVALAIGTLVVVTGLRRRSRVVRRRSLIAAGVAAAAAVVAVGMFGASAAASRTALMNGNDQARRGLDALEVGDVTAARSAFESAARSFDQATGLVDRPWTQPARLVPVIAQHRAAAATLASGAADVSARLTATLAELDLDSVRVVEGGIDLAAVEALEPRLLELQDAIDVLGDVIERAESPWLIDALQRRLRDTADTVERRREQGETALEAVRMAPSILGADGPKVYFVAFVTPAEVRGSLGFMGNFAELTIDRGEITLEEFGRHTDLREAGETTSWRIEGGAEGGADGGDDDDGIDEFLAQYGRIGFANRPGGVASPQVWQIVTASPHFPSTAQVIAQLYPQSGGRQIDGVLALDPKVVAALLGFTGPVTADDLIAAAEADDGPGFDPADLARLPDQIDDDNAEQFLLVDQYVLFEDDNPDRIDALEVLSIEVVERLLAGALPGPTELGRVMAPLAGDGHLAAWMADADAQTLVTDLGMAHDLPALDGGDGVAIALNNGSGNKIETFLEVDAEYVRDIDPETGFLRGTLTVELTNDAPSSGLPRYVIGNSVGLPLGWNRLRVALYAPFPYNGATLDGEPLEMTLDTEQGWHVMGRMVEIPPGESRTIEITFAGTLDRFGDDVEPAVMLPNLATPPTLTVIDGGPGGGPA